MRILVTGGSGFLGKHLLPHLLLSGHRVRVLSRKPGTFRLPSGVEEVPGDCLDAPSLASALKGCEVLYHLAGKVSFDPLDARALYALHVEGTRALLEEAKRAGVRRVVLASTSGTIAVAKDEAPRDENHDYPIEVVGHWPYYLSKIYEEKLALQLCRAAGIELIVINPSLLLGPGDDRLSSTWIVQKFLAREIPAMPSGGLSFVDVRDAAQVFANALTQGEIYGRHLVGVNMPLREFYERLSRMTGVAAPPLRLPSAVNVLGARMLERLAHWRGTEPALTPQSVEIGEHFFNLKADKAERLLGFHARDAHETLFDTVQDLQSRMPASVASASGAARFEPRSHQ
ncbi:MAG: NAD-dependent epimerase/dehydratase family protein [Myxococcaceae bacterium]